jgi:hypothetical protein
MPRYQYRICFWNPTNTIRPNRSWTLLHYFLAFHWSSCQRWGGGTSLNRFKEFKVLIHWKKARGGYVCVATDCQPTNAGSGRVVCVRVRFCVRVSRPFVYSYVQSFLVQSGAHLECSQRRVMEMARNYFRLRVMTNGPNHLKSSTKRPNFKPIHTNTDKMVIISKI